MDSFGGGSTKHKIAMVGLDGAGEFKFSHLLSLSLECSSKVEVHSEPNHFLPLA